MTIATILLLVAFTALLVALWRVWSRPLIAPRRTEHLDLSHLDADAVRRRLLLNTLDRR